MDLKEPGNYLFLVGDTLDESGGSHFCLVNGIAGGVVPKVDAEKAPRVFAAVHGAIRDGLVRSCHDLSEGGLAAAVAEMAFAGAVGAQITLTAVSSDATLSSAALLFSESNTRFVIEVEPEHIAAFQDRLAGVPCCEIGKCVSGDRLQMMDASGQVLIDAALAELKEAWQAPLRNV
jgi:phosphoribosylformylglycinamidine synthase